MNLDYNGINMSVGFADIINMLVSFANITKNFKAQYTSSFGQPNINILKLYHLISNLIKYLILKDLHLIAD